MIKNITHFSQSTWTVKSKLISDDQYYDETKGVGGGQLTVYGTWYRRVSSPAMESQGRLERLRPALPDG